MKFFAKGKRFDVYLNKIKNKCVIIKKERKNMNRARNEAFWLKKLNKYYIGPKLIKSGKNYLIYEFVEGIRILDFFEKAKKKEIIKVIVNILKKCKKMDLLKVNKHEMHNPYKHILIGKKVQMIDFERCKKVKKPKNVTQFCQFLNSEKVKEILKKKGVNINKVKLRRILKDYKKDYSNFNEILRFF